MNENSFWIRVWVIVGVLICVLAVCITAGISYQNWLIAKSADPLAVACGLGGNTASCILANGELPIPPAEKQK